MTQIKPARKTAAEAEALRLEEFENARFLKEYQTRLLTLVHDYYSENPYSVSSVGEADFRAFEFMISKYVDVRLPLLTEYDTRTVDQLRESMEDAERFLETTRDAQRIALERLEKKTAALAKLTEEERELLGL